MKLYLVRHGDAVDPRTNPERPLSETGIAEVELIGSHLAKAGVAVQTVLHSQHLRAQQTAERLGAHVSAQEIRLHPTLAPGDPVGPVLDAVRHFREDTMIVGHLPYMGNFASELLARDANRIDLIFDTATIACIGIEESSAWLNWLLNPHILSPAT